MEPYFIRSIGEPPNDRYGRRFGRVFARVSTRRSHELRVYFTLVRTSLAFGLVQRPPRNFNL